MVEVQLVQVHKDGVVLALEAVLTQLYILLFVYIYEFFVDDFVLRLSCFEKQQVRKRGSYCFRYSCQTLYTVDDTQTEVSSVEAQTLEYLFEIAVAP